MKISNFKFQISNGFGLTIMEVVIAVGIFSVIGVLLPIIIINTTNVFYKESSKVQQGLGINDTLASLREYIKGSNGVMTQYPTSGAATYTSSTTQMVLKLPALDSSNNIVTNYFDYFVFYLDQNRLIFKSFPDISQSARKAQNQILTSNVNSLKFQYYDLSNPPQEVASSIAKKIKVTLSLQQKSGKGVESITATSEANLRND